MHNNAHPPMHKGSSSYQPVNQLTLTAVQSGPQPSYRQRNITRRAAYSPTPQQPLPDWEVPPQAHSRKTDWELPPELHSAECLPARQPQADPDWELPPEQHNRHPVKELFTTQKIPISVLAPKKIAVQPLRKLYKPNGAPAPAPAQQAPMAGNGASQPLPDLLQLLMPRAGA
jgi:hypothetical protein